MGVFERVGNALVCNVPVLVIKSQSLARIFLTFSLDGMRIVITQNPLATWGMERQAVTNPMRYVFVGLDLPRFNL